MQTLRFLPAVLLLALPAWAQNNSIPAVEVTFPQAGSAGCPNCLVSTASSGVGTFTMTWTKPANSTQYTGATPQYSGDTPPASALVDLAYIPDYGLDQISNYSVIDFTYAIRAANNNNEVPLIPLIYPLSGGGFGWPTQSAPDTTFRDTVASGAQVVVQPSGTAEDNTKVGSFTLRLFVHWALPPPPPALPPDYIFGSRGVSTYGVIENVDQASVAGWAFSLNDTTGYPNFVQVSAEFDVNADGQARCHNTQQLQNALVPHAAVTTNSNTQGYGFNFSIPSEFKDGLPHQVTVCVSGGFPVIKSPWKFRSGISPAMIQTVLSILQ